MQYIIRCHKETAPTSKVLIRFYHLNGVLISNLESSYNSPLYYRRNVITLLSHIKKHSRSISFTFNAIFDRDFDNLQRQCIFKNIPLEFSNLEFEKAWSNENFVRDAI